MSRTLEPLSMLVLDDNGDDVFTLVRRLRGAGFALDWQRAQTESEFRAALNMRLDVIFADPRLLHLSVRRALDLLNEQKLDIPLIILSASSGEECGLDSFANEAADLVLKSRLDLVGPAVRRTLRHRRLVRESHELRAHLNGLYASGNFQPVEFTAENRHDETEKPKVGGDARGPVISSCEPAGAKEAARVLKKLPGGTETILMVEPDPELRRRNGLALVRRGYSVLPAESASAALERWAQQIGKVDLLLVSAELPGGQSGRDLAAQLRSCQGELKVVLMGDQAPPLANADTFLQRMCPPSELLVTVRSCLDRRE